MHRLLHSALARLRVGPKRSALAALVLLASLAVLSVAACTRTASIDFLITVPNELRGETRWIEVSVYDNVACSLAGRVAYGEAPVQGPVKRLLFSPGDKTTPVPEIGDLPSGFYSFVAQVKNENCEIIARGCDGLNVGQAGTVRIATRADGVRGPPCDDNMVCELAQCIPKRTGQNCSLDVVGSGPLVQGSEGTGLAISAPAARKLSNNFLVAYGEFSLDLGQETVLVPQQIAPNGGLLPFRTTAFGRRCASFSQTDGTGLAWSAQQTGVVGFARNECGETGELASTAIELMLIDANALALDERSATIGLSGAVPGEIRLGQNHALASLGEGIWAMAPMVANQAEAVFFQEADSPEGKKTFEVMSSEEGGQARVQFGLPGARHVGASIEASGTSVVMVAVNEFDEQPVEPVPDAGEPDAGNDEDSGAPDDDAGMAFRQGEIAPTFRQVSVQFLPTNKILTPGTLPRPFTVDSTFASVALVNDRAFVIGDGPTRQDPTLYAVNFLPGGNPEEPPQHEEYAILTNGEGQGTEIEYADVAVSDDRVFVATAVPGDIILSVFLRASTEPSPFRVVRLSQVRASTVGSIRNGRVSVAVAQNRVLVAWTTATELRANDPVGGYAIFACEP